MFEDQVVPLRERWNWIEDNRHKIVAEFEQLEGDLPKEDQRYVNRIKRWFSSSAGFEEAVENPDVLAICIPLAKQGVAPNDVSIRRAVKIGVCTFGQTLSIRNQLLRQLYYPLCQIGLIAAITIFFSIWIIPGFEAFFLEIQIKLPYLTQAIINFASLVRVGWKYLLVLVVGLMILAMIKNLLVAKRDVAKQSWLRRFIETNRNKAACWAWHVSMLLESGVQVSDAIKIAGKSQVSNWLKRASRDWVDRQSKKGVIDSKNAKYVFGQRYQLLETTLEISNSKAQADLFREIATYYWERNKMITEWWISWATSLLFWFFVVGVILAALAVYTPTFASISGLAGF